MTLSSFTGGSVQTNGFLLETDTTCIAIDAPAGFADHLAASGKTPTHLLLTHQHFDHVEDAAAFQKMGCEIIAQSAFDRALIRDDFAIAMGLPVSVPDFTVDATLSHGPLSIGDLDIAVAHVPGHSPDSITFHFPAHQTLIAGDTLFAGGIGRTDLPGGSHAQLLEKIRTELFTLPAETEVYPGHGPATTIGREIASNPYLK